jgi:8-amino-7-oxononanoate synthase
MLLDKFNKFKNANEELLGLQVNPFRISIDELYSSTEATINGKRTILAGTNNYLGLTFDNACKNAATLTIQNHGTGTTGSRMANGTYRDHLNLEHDLAEFYGVPYAIVFSTGYTANLGMISTLVGHNDYVLIDAHCHASIYDGCKLSGAEIIRFKHNDANDLDKRLQRLGDNVNRALIIVEGIYSMFGNVATLREIIEVKNRYSACLIVDEAHSLGVLGKTGRGLAEHLNCEEDVDFTVGTFSKSLGSIGGFCVSKHSVLETMRYMSRPYIFTASPSPATIASTRCALNIIHNKPELREKLWKNVAHLYKGLTNMGFEIVSDPSPIIAIKIPDADTALGMWKSILDRGVYVNLALPPATPDQACLLRCSLTAAHSSAQIDSILYAFSKFASQTDSADGQQINSSYNNKMTKTASI